MIAHEYTPSYLRTKSKETLIRYIQEFYVVVREKDYEIERLKREIQCLKN